MVERRINAVRTAAKERNWLVLPDADVCIVKDVGTYRLWVRRYVTTEGDCGKIDAASRERLAHDKMADGIVLLKCSVVGGRAGEKERLTFAHFSLEACVVALKRADCVSMWAEKVEV